MQKQTFRIEETEDGFFIYEKQPQEFGSLRENKNTAVNDLGQEKKMAYDKGQAEIWTWGRDNLLPQRREALIKSNNIVGTLIQTKRDITLGSGLMTYRIYFEKDDDGKLLRKQEEVEMPKDIKEWMDRNHIAHYFRAASKNFFFHANTFTEMIQARGYEKIASIESKECRHMRAEMHDNFGIIQNYFYSMHWAPKKGSNKRKNSIEKIPGYHPLYHKKLPGKKFIYHTGDELLSDDYYFEPTWWGGKEWISTANAVPRFHNANLRNGYTLRWHIEYPKDYFDSSPAIANSKEDIKKSQDKRKTRKREFIRQVNEMLAGYENAGRALFTSYEVNRALGKDFPGIKITPLKADIKDDALLKLFEKSNQANISAQAIHPTLANIETQGKLSSGSEIRNAYNMYLAIKTSVVRDILLEPINLVKKINKWPEDIHFGFRDIELTKLDDNKEAKQEVITE